MCFRGVCAEGSKKKEEGREGRGKKRKERAPIVQKKRGRKEYAQWGVGWLRAGKIK